jgi:hypothetical protein
MQGKPFTSTSSTSIQQLDSKSEPTKIVLTQKEQEEISLLSIDINTPLADLGKLTQKKQHISTPPIAPHPHLFSFFSRLSPKEKAAGLAAGVMVGELVSLGILWKLNKDWVTTFPTDVSVGNVMNSSAGVYGAITISTLLILLAVVLISRSGPQNLGYQPIANPVPAAAQPEV